MKRYYAQFGRVSNEYNLYWAETPEQIALAESCGYERISRSEAFRLCAAENFRRKHDPAFSGFADNVILPVDASEWECNWRNARNMYKSGYVIDRKFKVADEEA